jgi:hypothetical protein
LIPLKTHHGLAYAQNLIKTIVGKAARVAIERDVVMLAQELPENFPAISEVDFLFCRIGSRIYSVS